uniref:EGF-like domain-containing protein n=1 Tax=Panagrolaimus superbus TaxID=310955 RepID=A0A914YHB3_9BILA
MINHLGLGAVYLRSNRSNSFDFTSVLSPRYSCNYEYYAGYFTCQFGSTYQWVVDGVDGYGYRFRRSSDFHCLNPPVTQGPPTTSVVPPSACLNGGTFVNSTSTPFCYCGTFFTGPTCAERVCMHNGNPTANGCDCSPGYTGPFCEHISCNTDVFGGFNTDEKTLIVVIRQSPFIAQQVNYIAQAIQEQINYHAVNDATVYSWFILVSFSNDNIKWQEYSTSTDFLTNLVMLNTTNVQTGCNDTVIDAIASVFEVEAISAKSPIIVITDAPPDDGADYLTVVNRNTYRKLPVC